MKREADAPQERLNLCRGLEKQSPALEKGQFHTLESSLSSRAKREYRRKENWAVARLPVRKEVLFDEIRASCVWPPEVIFFQRVFP